MKHLFLATLMFTTAAASALEFRVESGNWTQAQYQGRDVSTDFTIKQNGSKYTIVDVANKITYELDLNETGPQKVPDAYKQYKKTLPGGAVLAGMIDTIRLTGLKKRGNVLEGLMNVDLRNRTEKFGWANFTLQVGVRVSVSPCSIQVSKGGNEPSQSKMVNCLSVESGHRVAITKVETSLGQSYDPVIGLGLDLMVKLFSPSFYTLSSLYPKG